MAKTETQLNELKINYLTEEQYNTAKDAGELNEDELYLTPHDDSETGGGITEIPQATETTLGGVKATPMSGTEHRDVRINQSTGMLCTPDINISNAGVLQISNSDIPLTASEIILTKDAYPIFGNLKEYIALFINVVGRSEIGDDFGIEYNGVHICSFSIRQGANPSLSVIIRNIDNKIFITSNDGSSNIINMPNISYKKTSIADYALNDASDIAPFWNTIFKDGLQSISISSDLSCNFDIVDNIAIHIG